MIFVEQPSIELLYKYARITLNLDKKDNRSIVQLFSGLKLGEEYEITIKKKSKRSLNANNYHWQLCEQIAKALRSSKYEVHNQLMIDYGTDWLDAKGSPSYVLMKDDDSYLRKETEHYRPTDAVEDRKGTVLRELALSSSVDDEAWGDTPRPSPATLDAMLKIVKTWNRAAPAAGREKGQ